MGDWFCRFDYSLFIMYCADGWRKVGNGVIYLNDKVIKRIDDLYPENTEYDVIKTDNGYNRIGWFNGQIWVEEADCENQTCVNFGKLSSSGLSIICAPHNLVIVIEDNGSMEDTVT